MPGTGTPSNLNIFYVASNGNVLTEETLAVAEAIEQDFGRFVLATSGSSFLGPHEPTVSMFTVIGTAAAGGAGLVAQAMSVVNLRQFVGGNMNLESLPVRAEILRSTLRIPNDLTAGQIEQHVARLNSYSGRSDAVDVVYHQRSFYDWQIMQHVKDDLALCAAALGFVTGYLLLHTASVWLTIVGFLNIMLSFPLAYFLFRDVLGNEQELPVLSIASVVITMGIAVDDVFVFIDVFRQATQRDTLREKIQHTLTHAGRATLFTSITSGVAFGSNALSEIPALRDFGLLTALVVASNCLLVMTFGLAGISIWWKWVLPLWQRTKTFLGCRASAGPRTFEVVPMVCLDRDSVSSVDVDEFTVAGCWPAQRTSQGCPALPTAPVRREGTPGVRREQDLCEPGQPAVS